MIETIEMLLRHWGEQVAQNGPGGGLPSAMGTIVEFAGCAPRGGVYGAKILLAGAGPDYAAAEVTQVLHAMAEQTGGAVLVRLAGMRYRNEPRLTIAEQVDVLELGRGDAGRRAYYRQVDLLHVRLQDGLVGRQQKLATMRKEARRDGERVRKKATQQAGAAHRSRGKEFEEVQGGKGAIAAHKARRVAARGGAANRSSGDSVP
ncbi:MAG: hypothetical protein KJ884_02070 [Gammaproteobacteria bacterium]|uniref:Uncharacterized protein n=1 Tax=viral metagenome TaxID=1070528 RepID=A0A6M3J828_9ZZZZ|nr:hypothetical protein [Gammaproteobacteria bacterium]MBU1492237.1 hypothetical protein [Gammaproteobacteria bacterium]MBU2066808.1 hypothetical protein [Gammaproteobacteria bacterium]MBU2137376.1 hypothetical protein [Gammaproteobacteria bacterium]MBU2215063.1 hypothetical protein [Gammaproteobacteria bacterium]